MDTVRNVGGLSVMMCDTDGAPIGSERDVLDLIGNAFHQGADLVNRGVPGGRV